MLENEGHWLKLMRTANLPTDANICLRISGEDIVCKVTKDVNKEVELKVTCHITDPENAQDFEHSEFSSENYFSETLKEDSGSNSTDEDQNPSSKSQASSQEMLDFASERSESFNEGMHSKSATQSDCDSMEVERSRNEVVDSEGENSEIQDEGCSSRVQVSPSRDDMACENAPSIEPHSSSGSRLRDKINHLEPEITPKLQQHREGDRVHKCQLCNFITQEQHILEKHLQWHRSPPIKRPSSKMTNAKSYCDACKIQFMSIDTYHVHKQLYCKGRHEKDEGSSSPPLPEHAALGFKPGPDTVIIRSSVNGGVPSSSLIHPQAIYAAISTNPLILLPCSLVNGQSLVPQTGVMPTGAPGIVLQSGIACSTIVEKPSTSTSNKLKEESLPSRKTSHPIMHFSSDTVDRPTSSSFRKRKMSEGDVLNLKKSCSGVLVHPLNAEGSQRESESTDAVDQDTPLDLSLKKFPNVSCRSPVMRKDSVISPGCHSPPNRTSSDSGSPQRPSVVHSRVTSDSPTHSYSNDSVHCYTTQIPVVLARQSSVDRVSPQPPVLHVDAPAEKQLSQPSMPPPKLVKQGNNVCEECNIVFYKYDNYLAHKRHYCAFRRRQLSALAAAASNTNQDQSSDDNNSNHSGLNDSSQSYQMDDGGKSGSRRDPSVENYRSVITKSSQYCCYACGVKFSTSDNLEAHQTYYCIKKADSAMSKVAAMRGDNSHSPQESPFGGPEEWKCNYCDATCSSYETIRRHLLTHSELRGFRCIVCGYKGNTLRGMRTHACEHITEGSTSIEEFISTKVVAENGIVPIAPNAASHSDDDSDNSSNSKSTIRRDRQSQSERTGTSSFKKNTNSAVDHSESGSNSPRIVEKPTRDNVPNSSSPVKREMGSSSPETNGNSPHDGVNPMAFCDVVIKTENDQSSGEDSSRDDQSKKFIKFEPEPEYDSDDRPQDLSKSPSGQSTSVIRRAPDVEGYPCFLPAKRKSKSQGRQNSEMKYCKVCDISFSHLSNFIAHKKFYCVSRVIRNCIQEAATVQ